MSLKIHVMLFFAVVQFLVHTDGVAQVKSASELIIHLDKPSYFIGETMWYKIYKTGTTASKAFYLELYDETGRRIITHKHYAENNTTFGNLTLPNTLKTGRYALVMSEQQSSKGFRRDILIVNPQEEKNQLSKVPFGGLPIENYVQDGWKYKFTVENGAIGRRENVGLNIEMSDAQGRPVNGNFSIAIKDQSKLIAIPKNQSIDRTVNTATSIDPMVIKGRVIAENGTDITRKTPLILQLIVDNIAHSVITDKKGEFEISIDNNLQGTNQVYFMNYKHFNKIGIPLKLEFMTEKPAVAPRFEVADRTLDLRSEAQRYLEKQVALSSFFASGMDVYNSITYQEIETGIRLHHEPDRLIIPDYYEVLPTMQEVFRELLGTVRVRKTEDGFRIGIRHQDLESVIQHDPLILVDGRPESDLDRILALNPRGLEKIEMFFTKEKIIQLGITGSNGILSITTKKKEYTAESVPTYEVEGFTWVSDFVKPDFSGEKKESPTPDLRTLLYWNPNIVARENGIISLDFYNSDSLGDIEVEIFGKTSDGLVIFKRITI